MFSDMKVIENKKMLKTTVSNFSSFRMKGIKKITRKTIQVRLRKLNRECWRSRHQ